MRPTYFGVAAKALLLALLLFSAGVNGQARFLPPEKAFQLSSEQVGNGNVLLTWKITPGYYLYQKAFKVEGVNASLGEVVFPPGQTITDEYFGEQEAYFEQVTLRVDPGQASQLALTWQGCAKAGLCYPPQSTTLNLERSGRAWPIETAMPDVRTLGDDQQLASQLSQWNVAWVAAAFFGMGLLLAFTPCVLPMLPILSSLIMGANAGLRRSLSLSFAYVIPMALTYAILGVFAGLAGANLQAALQSPWLLFPFSLIFVLLSLAMFGVFELQLPAWIRNRLDSAQRGQRGGTLGGAAIMGMLSALLVGPCMTAPLAGALLYIADTGNAMTGGLALFSLGLGMGAPLVIVGAVGGRLLPKPGPWMSRVKTVFGFVMLGMAVWFSTRVLAAEITLALWGGWLLAVAVALWPWPGHPSERANTFIVSLLRVCALVSGIWATALLLGASAGGTDPLQPLARIGFEQEGSSQRFIEYFEPVESSAGLKEKLASAGNQGQWTLVDFYADWCVSCKVIEEQIFEEPAVQRALADMQLLRPDVTDNTSNNRELMAAYEVLGPPTMMFFGPDGVERRSQRIVGELTAAEFLQRLEAAKESF